MVVTEDSSAEMSKVNEQHMKGFYGRPWSADQRKDLFSRMCHLGMNTYLYAPKDDLKHRAEWRLLYTSEEMDLLHSLIVSAKQQRITFVYSLSPGIDIVYSSEKDVKSIQEKLDQVRMLGCDAFALLFDDIEAAMNEQDKKKFSCFVSAQLMLANNVYEHLKCAQFYFCPTEYCESRATPTLEESDYLLLLGKKLLPNIHIMWTGPRVVSRYITVEHVRRVAQVLKRKPLIWDNLHANDYDPKRVFLGPFAGRSVKLKDEVSGILLNPNCRYEANFLPFHTMAEWNSCHADADLEEESDAVLEAGDVVPVARHIIESASPRRLYHPLKALHEALRKWMDHFFEVVNPCASFSVNDMESSQINLTATKPTTTEICESVSFSSSSESSCPATNKSSIRNKSNAVNDSSLIDDVQHSACTSSSIVDSDYTLIQSSSSETVQNNSLATEYCEPMELASIVKEESKGSVEMTDVNKSTTQEISSDVSMESSVLSENEPSSSSIDIEQVATLVDMFYLPFEHGRRGMEMLQEFSWLHENSFVVRKRREDDAYDNKHDEKLQEIVSSEWRRRSEQFIKNLHVLEGLVLWMAEGELNISPTVMCESLQKELYSFCRSSEENFSMESSQLNQRKGERLFDGTVGAFVKLAIPRTSFVAIENDNDDACSKPITAIVCAALDAKNFAEKVRKEYIPQMREKYQTYIELEKESGSAAETTEEKWQLQREEIGRWEPPNISDYFYNHFPSQIDIRYRDMNQDAVAIRRLIYITAVALSFNGISFYYFSNC
ncbi:unnamed protein product [Anisakis simplex]|uniref:protein O-GlcNAcase n=1 Tax=Anisakis simplex TaxID=6269 RepID=A0A158PN10_ANISI|nr:unnamed protein product [Anisakis simplex]